MRIADVTLADIRAGLNWKLLDPDDQYRGEPPEKMEIEVTDTYTPDDYVLYSGLQVTDSGKVYGLLLLKRVGDHGYGGDYYDFNKGRWTQVGLESEPDAEPSNEYIANPLDIDPSFVELRTLYRQQFQEWVGRLEDA